MAAQVLLLAVLHWLLCLCHEAGGQLLSGLEVPSLAFSGGRVNVSCHYNLRDTGLYSLKWYHNDTEFYRYVPSETHRPVDIKPAIKFQAHEVGRSETEVTLSLTGLSSAASGEYKCEVIAEHPSFRTEISSAFMTVLDEPLSVNIVGGRDVYKGGEDVRLGCEVRRPPPPSSPLPTFTWYLAGAPARKEHVEPYTVEGRVLGLSLHVPASQVWRGGRSVVVVECQLQLGSHQVRTARTLRVRVQHSSYVSTYFAAGCSVSPGHALLLLLLVVLVTLTCGPC